jgi:hypothetical protein
MSYLAPEKISEIFMMQVNSDLKLKSTKMTQIQQQGLLREV